MAEEEHIATRGTLVIALIFVAFFLLYFTVSWIWLSGVWHFGTP